MEPVPVQHKGRGFYSHYFVTLKKTGGGRPILDLGKLNKFVRTQRFKMVILATIIPALEKGDWILALDLQDAYFHVTIHPMHRRFLQFTLCNLHYQYKVLPFNLSTAPRIFSKVLAVASAHLRKQGVTIFAYLDDCLLKALTYDKAVHATHTTLPTLLPSASEFWLEPLG
ncbi:unnamed protein product [Lepidochelys kempii]